MMNGDGGQGWNDWLRVRDRLWLGRSK
jgi:hypothetical protein